MKLKIRRIAILSGVVLGFSTACAPVVPAELIEARVAYHRASIGTAQTVVPAELHKAKASLDEAERAFRDKPEAQRTRDLAYVAQRKAQLAEALAAQEIEQRRREQAAREYQTEQTQQRQLTQSELLQARARLADAERKKAEVEQKSVEVARKNAETEQRNAEMERRNAELNESLAKLAAKEEERGQVITLSGSVLFASNQAVLLPSALERLNEVAEALMNTTDRPILVGGHTDSRGPDGYNLELSRRRAEAVRTYLVSRGVAPDKIRAEGYGESRPVADNQSAEGRANNRRVEVVIERLSARR